MLVVHQWTGLGDYEKKRAGMLAQLGYNVFAVDIYGQGVRPTDPKDAGVTAGKYKNDRALLRAQVQAGLEVLVKHELTDPRRIAAIGYCFGGTTVLELARSVAEIAGGGEFPRRIEHPHAGRRQEHQGQGAGAAWGRRPVRAGLGGGRLRRRDAPSWGGLATGRLRWRGSFLHGLGRRQR